MILYHGTDIISALDIAYNGVSLNKSKKRLDFGSGFYLSNEYESAEKWASRDISTIGVILSFAFDINGLKLKIYEEANSEWGEEIFRNRIAENSETDVDCIIGPIADGRMQSLIAKVNAGKMSKRQFIEAVTPRLKSIQYVLKTARAVDNLKLIGKDVLK